MKYSTGCTDMQGFGGAIQPQPQQGTSPKHRVRHHLKVIRSDEQSISALT